MEILIPYKANINNRNHIIDFMKAIFAMCVVLVHFPLPGITGLIFTTLGICGVIFFFLVSGYYSYNIDDNIASKNILKRTKKIIIITIIVLLIYFIFSLLENLMFGDINYFLSNFKNPLLHLRIFILGDFSFIRADAMWYMMALIYSYLILYVLHKAKLIKYSYYLIPILIMYRIWIETYVNTYDTDWHYSSFYLASGFPIMLLGNYIACKKESFFKSSIFLNIIILVISIIFLFFTVDEIILRFNVAQPFKILFALELFLIALKLPNYKIPLLSNYGKYSSMYLYLFHLLIGAIIYDLLYENTTSYFINNWLIPFMVLIISIGISILIPIIKKLIYRRKQVS